MEFRIDLPQMPAPDGVPIELWPGVLWIRLPLPYRLDHVNVFLIEDGDGWALLDTGLGDTTTETIWLKCFRDVLNRPLTRIIVTHFHPDHIGMAGWIAKRFNIPVYMTQTEYLASQAIFLDPGQLQRDPYFEFYMRHGLDVEAAQRITTSGNSYVRMVRPLPPTFRSLRVGGELKIGRRLFRILTGGGHSREQAMLYCDAEGLFFSADQVLNRISPNVGVWALDPEADVLGQYLCSLCEIANIIPDHALVLPGHDLAFYGLHRRVSELVRHHETRCRLILEACHSTAKSAVELLPAIINRDLGPHEKGFAFGEVLAHVNYLRRCELLTTVEDDDKLIKFIAA